MTGIERLRALSAGWDEMGLGDVLADIAEQVERELSEERRRRSRDWREVSQVQREMRWHLFGHDSAGDDLLSRWAERLLAAICSSVADDVSTSAYDALPEDERDAIAWVREHGGLDYVRAEWRSRVPYDRYEARRQRLLGHITECETALKRRREIIKELGHRVNDLTTENAELRKRAMPEGMEWLIEAWPKFEDDAPVKIGDTALIDGDVDMVEAVQIWIHGKPVIYGDNGSQQLEKGERVKRPAVLAADGEPLEAGQTVWSVNDGREYKVVTVESPVQFDTTSIKVDDGKAACGVWIRPDNLTHQRHVLDADGVPIKKGDTVWHKGTGEKYRAFRFSDEGDRVWGESDLGSFLLDCSMLTHTKPEPPDSWERIGEDAKKEACAYFGVENGGYGCSECPVKQWEESCDEVKSSDLVRRCRALAERERGE